MDWALVILRFLHVVLGAYWAGVIIFTALYLEPSVRAAGPAGGQVMGQLVARGHLTVLPVVALVTILSGVDLLRRVSGGFDPAFMGSPFGVALSIGALAAIVAFIIGVSIMRPTALKVMALSQAAMQAPEGAARDAQLAAVAPLRRRATVTLRVVAVLLAVTVTTMAVGRYL
jgi:hypothetical protein